jgi:4-amino-4-deoxy-L-arabinose transferase-like glycosyltransferase
VAQAGSHRRGRLSGMGMPGWWPLLAVLAIQAGLSLRLVRADTAFEGEALHLHAGHLEWAHWLHGVRIPPFQSYLSGAPVIYPPLGAAADSVGGLAGARVLSLAFMLGATALLWGTTGRLFGRRAAFFAAALFAVLGPTLHLGVFATYDAMSLFLVALAAWCVVRAGDRGEATGWMVAAGAALAVANAAAYSSALFDLFVVALVLLTAFPKPGGRLAAGRIAALLTTTITLLLLGLLIGGGSYLSGFERTILARVPSSASPLTVLAHSWSWAGLIVCLAVCSVIISWVRDERRMRTWLLAVLAAAAVVGPLEQARLHTAASLNKHVGLGAWFAAMAAGYAVDRFILAAPAGRTRALTCGACVIALVFPLSLGASQSRVFSTSWPNAGSFIAIMRPLAAHSSGRLLVEDPSIAEYYLPAGNQWQRWSSTRNIVLPSGASTGGPSKTQGVAGPGDAAAFARFIARGYFSVVALNFADTTALDHRIAADLRRNPHYHITQVVPYGIEVPPIGQGTYVIWRYEPHTVARQG